MLFITFHPSFFMLYGSWSVTVILSCNEALKHHHFLSVYRPFIVYYHDVNTFC